MDWISQHSTILNLIVSVVMAIIWIAYLQLFLLSYLRQRRPIVLISRTAGAGDNARCFVSNMGAEPIYLTALIADVTVDGEVHRSFVTDREELTSEDLSRPGDATTQGPISSGGYVDAGAFGTILSRALDHLGLKTRENDVTDLTLTVICNSGHSNLLVAAYRAFRVGFADERRQFIPRTPGTEQAASRRRRKQFRDILQKAIDAEAAQLSGHHGSQRTAD